MIQKEVPYGSLLMSREIVLAIIVALLIAVFICIFLVNPLLIAWISTEDLPLPYSEEIELLGYRVIPLDLGETIHFKSSEGASYQISTGFQPVEHEDSVDWVQLKFENPEGNDTFLVEISEKEEQYLFCWREVCVRRSEGQFWLLIPEDWLE